MTGLAVIAVAAAALRSEPSGKESDSSSATARTNGVSSTALTPKSSAWSPVGFFRELLAADPAERERLLNNKPAGIQQRLLAKVAEYEALTPDDRELRLRMTEIRWHLTALMHLPADQRDERLALVPEADRAIVRDRLMRWEILPPMLKQEVMDNEMILHYLMRVQASDSGQTAAALAEMSPDRRRKYEAELKRWSELPPEQRDRIQKSFNQFFDLNEPEKQKILGVLSEPERRQMEKTLATFDKMPQGQREQCIRSFHKFAGLKPEERDQFLRNAERWQEMTPAEREDWRTLVRTLPEWPPLPPGLDASQLPPLPPGAQPSANGAR